MNALSVVIAGGGTGGHVYPGLAVARELLARYPDARISFAGTAAGLEARVVPREGFQLDLIHSAGLKGKSILAGARGVALLPRSFVDAWRLVSARRPDIVIGVGGYSSGPVVLAAYLRGVVTMLLEQNAVPGVTNRLLARFVQAAAVTFDATATFFGPKAFVSGNPVRPEFYPPAGTVQQWEDDDRTSVAQVLIFGGSQGAHAINMAMVEAAPRLAAGGAHFRVTHQTGERDVELVRSAYERAGLPAIVEPFLFDMGRRIREADLIVCRSGATTVAEIAAAAKPAILIPLPTAADDHQRRNAEALGAAGAAEVLLQADLTPVRIADRVLGLAADAERRRSMSTAIARFARPDAARVIVDRAVELVQRRAG